MVMVGIDLGTTNSCVAYWDGRAARVIPNRDGARTTPSIVAFDDRGNPIVGAAAQRQGATNPENTIFAAKRLMGRKLGSSEIGAWVKNVPYRIAAAPNGDAWIQAGGKLRSPEEFSSLILREMKSIAEEALGEEVTSATVTVPAYFNDNQRQATKDAGAIAGLKIDSILNEPTAAALAYGVGQEGDQTFAVFDLGGGTFDISILRKTGDVFEVLATSGDTFLGGNDFDARLASYLGEKLRADSGVSTHGNPSVQQRLTEAAEQAKCRLSTLDATSINLPFLAATERGPVHLLLDRLPRATFERLCGDLMRRLEDPCRIALECADLSTADIDQVLLVGGMTRMPAVRQRVHDIFGAKIRTDLNPDETVALGAACQCAILTGAMDDVALLDVTPYALGVRVLDSRMSVVIPKNCAIPTSAMKRFATTKDKQREVSVEIFQGDSENVEENTPLGAFVLQDLPQRPAGHVEVDVKFEIDGDGKMQVSAKETSTGKETSIRVHPAGGLRAADIQRIKQEQRAKATQEASRAKARPA